MPLFSVDEGFSGQRPGAGDVRAEGVEALDEIGLAFLQEPQPRGEGEVSATGFSGHDDAGGIDPKSFVLRSHPRESRDAVVEAGRVGRHFGRRRSEQRIAEVDHRHGHALLGDQPAPGAVVPVEARHHHHAAAVDVVDAGHDFVVVRPDVLHLDGVAIGLRGELEGFDPETGRGRNVFVVTHGREGLERLAPLFGFRRVLGGEQFFAAVEVSHLGVGKGGEDGLDARIDASVGGDVGLGHGGISFGWRERHGRAVDSASLSPLSRRGQRLCCRASR